MRMIDPIWRVAVAAVAIVLSILVVSLDPPVPLAVALIATLLMAGGAVARRAWIPLVPFGAAAVYCLGIYARHGGDVSGTSHDASWGMIISMIGFIAMLAAVGLAFGVALRWAIDTAAERRRGRPQAGALATR